MISTFTFAAALVSGALSLPQFPSPPTRQPYQPPSIAPYSPQQYTPQPYSVQPYSAEPYSAQPFGAKQASSRFASPVPKSPYPSPSPSFSPVSPSFAPVSPSFAPSPYSAQPKVQQKSGDKDAVAQIVSEHRDANYDGTFNYGFESDNGISMKAEGYVKDVGSEDPKQVIQGTYFYYDKDGQPISVSYIADEQGFRAEGDIIPKPSKEILESLEKNKAEEATARNDQNYV